MDRSRAKALRDFVVEAEDILENLAEDLETAQEQFEKTGKVKPDRINKIFREMHSLKGLASMFNLERITTLSHDLESLLDRVRLGKASLTPELFTLLGECRSTLRTLVAEAKEGEEKTEVGPLLALIAKGGEEPILEKNLAMEGLLLDEASLKSFTEYEEFRLKENLTEGNHLFSVQVGFDFSDFDVRLRALTERLSETGEVISTLPVVDPALSEGIHFRLIYGTMLNQDVLEQQVADEKGIVTNLLTTRSQEPAEGAEDQAAPPEAPDGDSEDYRGITNTVRVDIEKLDSVMGIVGELNLLKVAFDTLTGRVQVLPDQSEIGREMAKQVRSLEKKLGDLQRAIIDIRLVPIGQIFSRLNRTARRLARSADKQVSVRLYGSETELDKMMMDDLVTPLVHILRNSIDHGIEPAEDRLAAGKPAEGLLTISAYQKGNSIVLEVTDDGKGLQFEKIREAAVKRGFIAPDAELTPEETLELIFKPGFSSAEVVTEVSGRGVGLDAVKEAIDAMKGSLVVWSEPGKGTTFQIQLPITLAIIQSLIVESCGEAFAIPISSILETFRTSQEEIQLVDKREVFNLRGSTLPLLRIENRFRLERSDGAPPDEVYVVVARRGDKAAGIVVDTLLGEQETVVHPIGRTFGRLPGLAGATEVGENQVILVIDTASLFSTLETSAAPATV